MLYATTRNNVDAFTPHRVLTSRRGPDGGLYVPFRIPRLSDAEIMALAGKNFNSNLADCLNLQFGTHLTGYDIDLAMGKNPVRLQQLGQKIIMGELWHNTHWKFSRMVQDLSALILADKNVTAETDGWANIGILVAVIFGMFGELIREGIASFEKKVDISLISGDFSGPMAAWYARQMGVPIGDIVCCCNENSNLWNFICHGQLRTDGVAVCTVVPEGDFVIPDGLERLISMYGGPEEVQRYVDAVRTGSSYHVENTFLHRLRQGIYVTVSSERRILNTIPNTWNTHRYLPDPATALAYAGLQDYRARTGGMRTVLILSENCPSCSRDIIMSALNISEDVLKEYLK